MLVSKLRIYTCTLTLLNSLACNLIYTTQAPENPRIMDLDEPNASPVDSSRYSRTTLSMGNVDPKNALERHVSNPVDLSVQNAPKPSQARGTDLECFRRVHVLQLNTPRHWMRELRSLLLSAIKALQAVLARQSLLIPEWEKNLELVGRVNGSLGVFSIIDWTPDLDCALPILGVESPHSTIQHDFSQTCEQAYRQLRDALNMIRSLTMVDEKAKLRVSDVMRLLLLGTRQTNSILLRFLASTDVAQSGHEKEQIRAFPAYVAMVRQDMERLDAEVGQGV